MEKITHVYKSLNYNAKFLVSKYWCGEDPDKKSDISGLSLKDVLRIQKSWSYMYAKAYPNGLLVFQRIFKADPPSQKFFKYVAEATEEELATSPVFRAHVVTIMSSLNNAVENLQQPEIVVPLMEKIGESHNSRQIRKRHFWLFRDVMLEILKQDLKYGDDTVGSWEIFLEFMNTQIITKILV